MLESFPGFERQPQTSFFRGFFGINSAVAAETAAAAAAAAGATSPHDHGSDRPAPAAAAAGRASIHNRRSTGPSNTAAAAATGGGGDAVFLIATPGGEGWTEEGRHGVDSNPAADGGAGLGKVGVLLGDSGTH